MADVVTARDVTDGGDIYTSNILYLRRRNKIFAAVHLKALKLTQKGYAPLPFECVSTNSKLNPANCPG